MARILYWNIRNFTNDRISAKKRRLTLEDEGDYGTIPLGHEVRDVIVSTVTGLIEPGAGAVQFDFVVLVEVVGTGGNAVEGDVVQGLGLTGCLTMLALLREQSYQWMLVPPIVTGAGGKREAVAVFFRSDRWTFVGPQLHGQAYPTSLRMGLPFGNVPMGYPCQPGQPFTSLSGQFAFPDANGFAINFPTVNDRKPFLTAFSPAGDPTTLLRLFAVHTSPASAWVATENLAMPYAMSTEPPIVAHQIDVIVGDFNVENTDPATFALNGPFEDLLNLQYSALIRPPVGLPPQSVSYYATHGIPSGSQVHRDSLAQIVDTEGGVLEWKGHYPGYAYADTSLDNVLVRYRGLNPPLDHHTTIVPRTYQTPYAAPGPNPQPLTGYFQSPPAWNRRSRASMTRRKTPDRGETSIRTSTFASG